MELLAAIQGLLATDQVQLFRFIRILNMSETVLPSGCLTGKKMDGEPQPKTGEESGLMEAVGRGCWGTRRSVVLGSWPQWTSGNERADALANHAIDRLLTE